MPDPFDETRFLIRPMSFGCFKAWKGRFRFTVDLRTVNAQTKKTVWSIPNAEAQLSKISGSKVYFSFDFIHGYWQLPFAEDSCD